MQRSTIVALTIAACFISTLWAAGRPSAATSSRSWNPRAAAAYLDGRMDWWLSRPTAQRDRGTSCVSCHTALPYALARPALRGAMAATADRVVPAPERRMLEHIVTRVTLWKDVEHGAGRLRGRPGYPGSRHAPPALSAKGR